MNRFGGVLSKDCLFVAPDKDAVLDLEEILKVIYERGHYHLSIDYSGKIPPPNFSESDMDWIQEQIS